MNEQPSTFMGDITALIIVFMFCYFFMKSYNVSLNSKHADLFTVGYIEDIKPNPVNVVINNSPANGINSPIYNDCVQSLMALGMKKKASMKMAQDIFTLYNPQTIQEFLSKAMSRK